MKEPQKNSDTNSLLDSAIAGLRRYVERVHKGNVAAAKRKLGMTGNTLDSWLNGTRRPTLAKIGPVLEQLHAFIAFPDEPGGRGAESLVPAPDAEASTEWLKEKLATEESRRRDAENINLELLRKIASINDDYRLLSKNYNDLVNEVKMRFPHFYAPGDNTEQPAVKEAVGHYSKKVQEGNAPYLPEQGKREE